MTRSRHWRQAAIQHYPDERTTPAGRFVAALGHNLHGEEILWVNYDTAISLHRVITSNPKERRAQRLATPTPLDNRISYGCINVPVKFYEQVISPTFAGRMVLSMYYPKPAHHRKALPGIMMWMGVWSRVIDN